MKDLRRWKKRLSLKLLRNQIILWFVGVIVLLLSILAGFTLLMLKPYLYDTHLSQINRTVSLLNRQLSSQRQTMQTYSINILSDATVQKFLKGELTETSDIANTLRLLMMRYTEFDPDIHRLYLVDGEGNMYGNNVTQSAQAYVNATLKDLEASSGSAVWSTSYPGGHVVMYRVIHDTTYDLNQDIGALYMVINRQSFDEGCKRILDQHLHYRVESADGKLILGEAPPDETEAKKYLISNASANGWNLSVWIAEKDVYAPANAILNVLVYCLAGMLLMGVCLTVFISGRLTQPLRELRHAMARAGQGNLDANVGVHREDEIARLARAYNEMLADTKRYIQQHEENQRRQKELELKTLQYQINPHFLYNTLDSIHMMARRNGNVEISQMVLSLSALFRLSLAGGRDIVTLEDELKYITYYLQIQRIRFQEEFRWQIDVPEELLPCRVMKFLLQPLVENSLTHGLRGGNEDGCIQVTARHERDQLVICVKDNGIGMTEQQLNDLRIRIERTDEDDLKNPFAGGVGVRNVHQRLLLFYGRGLDIQSDWEEGTTITITIPFLATQQQKEEVQ